MFSRGRVVVLDKDGDELPDDPFLKKIANPNFAQSQQDYLYQHLFFKGLGNNLTRVITSDSSKNIDKVLAYQNLIPSLIDYNEINKVDKFIYAESDKELIKERILKYELDNTTHKIPIRELLFFYDVTNDLRVESTFKSPSRITSLLPSIKNIEEAQKSKNINLNFSSKFIVSGKKQSGDDPYKEVLLESDEKSDIENKIYHKDIHAVPNGLEVHNLASDFTKLMYEDGMAGDFLRIANAYGMNKDVLNWALNGASTHENQSTALAGWIQNSIQFEADDWGGTHANYLDGYASEGKKITMRYDHLPVMQVVQQNKQNAREKQANMLKTLVDAQMPYEDALLITGLKDLING